MLRLLMELIVGLVIYRLFRRVFYDENILEVETSHSSLLFSVADRLEKLHGGKIYVGLRIPDAGTRSRQNVDMVLVTKRKAVVISVLDISGLVLIDADGSWICRGGNKGKTERLPDPVVQAKGQVAILESYLEQRGVALPNGYLSCRVVCPNPSFRTIHSNYFPSEVVTYEQWIQLKPEPTSMFAGWIGGTFFGRKREMQESMDQKLNFILSTSPMWDRLEYKGNKYILGEFLEFKGKQEDTLALMNIRRSKVNLLIIQKPSLFYIDHSNLKVLYSPRDYRRKAPASDWKEITVKSSTEALFQPQNHSKACRFKLSAIVSMSLSA